MDELFTPVSQVYTTKRQEKLVFDQADTPPAKTKLGKAPGLSCYADALEALKSEPGYEALSSTLEYLISGSPSDTKVKSIHSPNPLNSQIIQALVTEIVPNYWRLLKDEAKNYSAAEGEANPSSSSTPYHLLLTCLRNLSGVNAILTHLRGLMGELEASADSSRRSHAALTLELSLDLLCSLLAGPEAILQIWQNTTAGLPGSSVMARPLAQELVNVLGGGRVVSVAAEVERTVRKEDNTDADFWVAASKNYSLWLLQNIIYWARKDPSESQGKLISELLVKAFRLGHCDLMVQALAEALLVQESEDGNTVFDRLFKGLPLFEQKRLLYSLLKFAPRTYFGASAGLSASESESSTVAAVAGLLGSVVLQVESRVNLLVSWLTDPSGAAPGESVGIRRAVIAVVAQKQDDLTTVVEKSLEQFGDQLYVRHAPLLQQEAHAQVLLLSAGYLHRANPIKLSLLARSGAYMNAISNRLGAPQTRARILGMIVGEAISSLAKTGGKGLDFDMNETKSDDSKWYKALVEVSDSIGPVDSLRKRLETHGRPDLAEKAANSPQKPPTATKTPRPTTSQQSKKPVIMEVVDSDGEEDDLVPYAKPDSDAEDSEDDAELVRRDKPRAPVYIRDLITYLRDSENYDRQRLALTTAPILIRRKASYGTEVQEHAEELATLLLGVQDKYDMDDFADLRIQGMVAVFVAQPQKMGPWFSRTFFDGDYSLSQRASVLTVLGLGSRELAGHEKSEYAESAAFPSKRLPESMERLYLEQASPSRDGQSSGRLQALAPNVIENIARSITQSVMAPMAASAADAATGPDALKLSSFTSRLQQKQGSSSSSGIKARLRAIPNTTAQLLCTAVFFPLTARSQVALRASPTAGGRGGVVAQPELLSHLLRTLGLLVHAAGPSTLSLPDMTAELWRLVLKVRARCAGELGVTRAALFALLALLDVNGGGGGGEARMRDVCRDLGREVVETQEWVSLIFEGTRGGDGAGGEEDEVKMLAAGVLIRLREAMDKFRAFMIGDLIG
ncbi:hypothetical protein RB595_007772 [Gaeumannomyces hyphopodioides]